jgi:cardiolipin synthase A/B
MSQTSATEPGRWLRNGTEAFAAMLAAIDDAREHLRLETYIFEESPLGHRFRAALARAAARGVRVQVLVDAFGSIGLSDDFWQPLRAAGGDCRWFNPLELRRLHFRDHRKVLVCDHRLAIIGGFNISPDYEGDGIGQGWRDHGLALAGPLVAELAQAFDEMFQHAARRHPRFVTLRRTDALKQRGPHESQLLLSGPGRGHNPIARSIIADLSRARDVAMTVAYFLPTWRMYRSLIKVVRRGGRVRLVLAGRSDVLLSKLATQSLYRRLLRAGVELYEYEPQILHAKLLLIGDATYVGSSNLDPRSLRINYELMVRLETPEAAREARALFEEDVAHSRRVELAAWQHTRTLWMRFKCRIAHFLIARVDPHLASWQLKQLR